MRIPGGPIKALVFAAAALGIAQAQQPSLRLDLSGPWQMQTGDNPAHARADFNDSNWTQVSAPLPTERPAGFWWLRRTVSLPPWLPKDSPLVLSVGAFNQVFEVFVNGQNVAAVGSPTLRNAYTPRPRRFALPAHFGQPGARLVIAIRAWTPGGKWPAQVDASYLFPDRGPWLLTGEANAPAEDDGQSLALRESRTRWSGITVALNVTLGLLVVFGWTFHRDRREFLFFAGFLFVEALLGGSGLAILIWDLPLIVAQWFAVFLEVSPLLLSLFALRFLPGFWRWTPAPQAVALLWIAGLNSVNLALDRAATPLAIYMLGSPFEILTGVLMAIGAIRSARILHREQDRELTALALLTGLLSVAWIPTVRILLLQQAGFTSVTFVARAILGTWVTLRMLAGLGAARQRLAGEMEAARTVQQLLMPSTAAPGVDAIYLPASEVGGDFWHFLDNRLVVIGDVSGKGLKAAMIVSMVTGALRNRRSDSPAALLAELNAVVQGNPGFVTCCVARFDPDGRITVANAGHPAPYLNGRELDLAAGLPLGVTPDAEYTEESFALDGPLTFVSDGVVEAANAKGELFGFERTLEFSGKTAQEIAEAAKAWGQNDDITVVTVRRSANVRA